MKNKTNRIIWVDIETTGLDPYTDTILEAAIVITNSDFKELDRANVVLHHNPNDLKMNQYVWNMHTKTGLIEECANAGEQMDTAYVDSWFSGIVIKNGARGAPLGGSSVHFDRSFIQTNFYQLAKLPSHRHVDLTTAKILAGSARYTVTKPATPHRAMSDILADIENAKRFATVLRAGAD